MKPMAFTWRRAEYFFHNRAAIGIACAQATALRTHVAPHAARRLRAHFPSRVPCMTPSSSLFITVSKLLPPLLVDLGKL